jgi:hypothetical protein
MDKRHGALLRGKSQPLNRWQLGLVACMLLGVTVLGCEVADPRQASHWQSLEQPVPDTSAAPADKSVHKAFGCDSRDLATFTCD